MEQEILKTTISPFHKLPKWLRVIVIILSILTIIWWFGWLLYKFNKAFRVFLAWVSQPRNYYWFEGILIFSIICGLFVAQFCSDLKPFTRLFDNIKELINNIRDYLASLIKS